jgi:hypothetical protein
MKMGKKVKNMEEKGGETGRKGVCIGQKYGREMVWERGDKEKTME